MRRTSPLVNVLLFAATVLTTVWAVGAGDPVAVTALDVARAGLPYSAALMSILLAHEMGHYVLARLHRVDTTLPFFIPVPFGFGTLGAVIRIRSAMPSLAAVLDIGASGPIAGFVVALPLLIWGFSTAEVVHGLGGSPNAAFQSPFALVSALVHHSLRWPPSEASVPILGDSLLTWATARIAHGPLPAGADLKIGAVGYAAWIGMFVTTLNMTPIGQTDGGHVIFALFGRWGELVSRLFSWVLFGLGIFASWSWLVWWAVTRFAVGVRHPPASDMATPLTPKRRAVAVLSLAILVLTFVPVPIAP